MQWSCGSVFQTGLPLWARNRGSKDPRLLRDRPADGAAWARKNLCGGGLRIGSGEDDWHCRGYNGAWARGFEARGFENLGPLRDRPADRTALAAKIYAGGACKVLRGLG